MGWSIVSPGGLKGKKNGPMWGPQGKKLSGVLEMTGPISGPSPHLYSSERKENLLLLEGRFLSCYPSIPLSEEV